MTGQTYNHVVYSLGYKVDGVTKNYSMCDKGDVVNVLKHRFEVKNGMTALEAYHWVSLTRMRNICFQSLYQKTTEKNK